MVKTQHNIRHMAKRKYKAIMRKAGLKAWETMRKPGYKRAAKIGRKAVEAFLVKHRAAA